MWKQPIPTQIEELRSNPFAEHIFQMLLLHAANEHQEFRLKDGTYVILERGDVLFGRFAWNEMFNFPRGSKKLRNMLSKSSFLDNNLDIRSTTKYTIISIKNFDYWVSMDNKSDNRRTTDGQQTDTHKSVKSDKSVKNNSREINKKEKKNSALKEEKETPSTEQYKRELNYFLQGLNKHYGKNYKSIHSLLDNYIYWRETYSLEEIIKAARRIKYHKFWRDKMTPTILFRQKNPSREPVNYIEELLNTPLPDPAKVGVLGSDGLIHVTLKDIDAIFGDPEMEEQESWV